MCKAAREIKAGCRVRSNARSPEVTGSVSKNWKAAKMSNAPQLRQSSSAKQSRLTRARERGRLRGNLLGSVNVASFLPATIVAEMRAAESLLISLTVQASRPVGKLKLKIARIEGNIIEYTSSRDIPFQ